MCSAFHYADRVSTTRRTVLRNPGFAGHIDFVDGVSLRVLLVVSVLGISVDGRHISLARIEKFKLI